MYKHYKKGHALNFKLTPAGLANVQSVLPTFVDIPFQLIPL